METIPLPTPLWLLYLLQHALLARVSLFATAIATGSNSWRAETWAAAATIPLSPGHVHMAAAATAAATAATAATAAAATAATAATATAAAAAAVTVALPPPVRGTLTASLHSRQPRSAHRRMGRMVRRMPAALHFRTATGDGTVHGTCL